MLVGVLEAIPLVGSLIASTRQLGLIICMGHTYHVNEERGKSLGYSTVRYHGWKNTEGACEDFYEPSQAYRDYTTNEPLGQAFRQDSCFAI